LSDGDRAIFREAARESNRFMREQWGALEARSQRQAREAGVAIVADFDRKPFEAAMAGIHAKAAADAALRPLIDRIRQVQ
jgi:TRAP-type C4-dicarboxylate transport system substrate-binding protein